MENTKILNILAKAKDFLSEKQLNLLHIVLEEELSDKQNTNSTDIVVASNVYNYIGIYLVSKKVQGLSDNTIASYKQHLYRFAQTVGKNIEDINTMDIRRFIALCMKNGLKNTSIATEISILKTFFSWLKNEDYIGKNPMNQIKNIKINKYLRSSLTQREIELIRNACETTREKAIFEFFFSTGCRLEEVVKLDKEDIDWKSLSVKVLGKGNKERIVFLTPKAEVFLQKYLSERIDDNCALFVSERKPHNRLGRRTIERIFHNLGVKSGIGKSVFPHLIRHSMATILLNNGSTLTEVQRILGHESPVTTQIYAQLNIETIQQSHKKHIA